GTDGRTIKDESGNNNHGTFVGETFNDGDLKPSCPNCPVQTTGKYGNALRFDGTDDYVDMGNKAILNINGPITVGLWVYWTGSGDQVLYSNVNGAVVMGIHIRTSGTNTLEVYYNYNGNYWYRYTSSFSPNMWHYIAFTFDAATSTLTLYIDGVGTSSGSSTPYPRGVANTNIGRRPDIGVAYFNGTIDEVRVYNRALSAAEVAEDMNSPYPIDRPVASYSFEKIVNNKAWDTHKSSHSAQALLTPPLA
ncbi:MAG: LamG domain-containing protein, partial [Candidatus Aenigmarchaeota archaeon]|nr:LamG domain-containing protein [Candidatus Aenigmarchaeota archaeon]